MPDVTIKSLQDVPKGLEKSLWDFLNIVKHNSEVQKGTKGTLGNKTVTFKDLEDTVLLQAKQFVEVVDIDNPSPELASKNGSVDAGLLIAYQAGAEYQYTHYDWANANITENSPYVVPGDGGSWVAVAGKYIASEVYMTKLTALRILSTDANKKLTSTDLIDWILEFSENQVVVTDLGNGKILLSLPQNVDTDADVIFDTATLESIQFELGVDDPAESEGLLHWNDIEHTINIITGLGPILQVGQEQYILAFNDTGIDIDNGDTVRINAASGDNPTISLAKADSPLTTNQLIGMATMDIPEQTIGIVTTFGKVRGINTSSCSPGDIIYLSSDTAGGFTNVQPAYPNYIMQIGQCVTSAVDGIIFIKTIGRIEDILENAFNGGFLESINFTVASNGTTITGTLENSDDTKNLTMNYSTGFEVLDTTTSPITVTLTAGTDPNPQKNFVYIPISTKTLTVSISDWPSGQHIKVANILLRTASTTQSDGALGNRNWNDHIASSSDSMGHIQHMAEKLRQFEAQWASGAEGSLAIVGGSTPDDLFVSATSGEVYQLHKQTFPALDMQTGDDIHVVNDSVSSYKTISNLNSELTDASGNSLSNKYYSLVVWGVINRSGTTSHLMVNLPISSYNSSALALSDPSNYSVYDVPADFQGLGFLIARFTLKHSPSSSGEWTLEGTQDLRGYLPNTTAGGGAGGGGVSTFTGLTDTPSSYSGQAGNFPKVNSGETALEFTSELHVPSNTKVALNGVGGNTYIIYNSGANQVEIWKGGVLQVSW